MEEINSWNIESNFWEVNTHFKAIDLYGTIYQNDKSKNKTDSSILMWALAFYCSFNSKFRQLSEKERKELISKDILKNSKFDWKSIEKLIQGWDMFKSPSMKLMVEWERLINEKTIFLKTLTYNAENADTIEKLLTSNTKLYKEYEDILARLSQEQDGGSVKGGSKESLLEVGDI